MDIGKTRIEAGAITLALHYRNLDGGAPHQMGGGSRGGSQADQGVCIQVAGNVGGKETELLRFDCFLVSPHYHYGPENENIRIQLDRTITGDTIGWTMRQLGSKLHDMLDRAGCHELAHQLDDKLVADKLTEVEASAREMAAKEKNNVTHNRGEPVIDAGAIRFGLELRTLASGDGGMADSRAGRRVGRRDRALGLRLVPNVRPLPLRAQEPKRADLLG